MQADYGRLEELRSSLWNSRARDEEGELQLSNFYDTFKDVPRAQLEMALDQAEEWRKSEPQSYLANLITAIFHERLTWKRRGNGFADTVTSEGWDRYRSGLARALDALLAAEGLTGKDAEVYARLVSVLSQYHEGKAADLDAETYLSKGIAFEPTYQSLYHARLNFISPQWGGEPHDPLKLANLAAEATKSKFGDGMYSMIGSGLTAYGVDCFKTGGFEWKRMKAGFEDQLKRFPNDTASRYRFARLAAYAGDRDTAKQLFDRLGSEYNDHAERFFRDEKNFRFVYDWSMGKLPAEPRPSPVLKGEKA